MSEEKDKLTKEYTENCTAIGDYLYKIYLFAYEILKKMEANKILSDKAKALEDAKKEEIVNAAS